MANSLITNNTTRSNRVLRSCGNNPEGEVFTIQWPDMQREANGIAQFIKSRTDAASVLPGNILVLAPRREFGYLVRDELRRAGVSAHSFFSEEIIEGDPKDIGKCQAQRMLALLILLADREDRVALRCWCGFGNNTLCANAWARLRSHCEQHGQSPWQVLEQLEAGALRIPYSAPIVERFTALKTELSRLANLNGDALVSAVFPPDQDWAKPLADLNQYFDASDFGAKELVDVVRRHITQPELPMNVDYVRVMSLHKSKGLTSDMVVVVGCLEGLMPYIDYQASQPDQIQSLEEQRRLFYVAITRTKHVLVLSSVTTLPTDLAHRMRARVGWSSGGSSATITSRFLGELGQECPHVITGNEFIQTTVVN